MSALRANLRILFTRVACWLWYALLLWMWLFWLLEMPEKQLFAYFIFFVYPFLLSGLYLLRMHMEIQKRPFSLGLPGYRVVLRSVVFISGVLLSLIFCLPSLLVSGLSWPERALITSFIFFCGMSLYLLPSVSYYLLGRWLTILGLVGLIFVIRCNYEWIRQFSWQVVAVSISILGLIICIVTWLALNPERVHQRHRKLTLAHIIRTESYKKRVKVVPIPAENLFLAVINKYQFLSIGRYVWGRLFETLLPVLASWKLLLFVVPCAVSIVGFADQSFIDAIFLPLLGLVVLPIKLPVWSSILTPGGRKERFAGTVFASFVITLVIAAIVGLASIISDVLVLIIPEFTLFGKTVVYHSIDVKMVYLTLFVIPLTFTVQLYFHRWPIMTSILMVVISIPLFYVLFVGLDFFKSANVVSMIGICALGWVIFLGVLRYICLQFDLVGQQNDPYVSI